MDPKELTKETEIGMDTSVNPGNITPEINKDVIEETLIENIPILGESVDNNNEDDSISSDESPEIETTVEDCEVLYGVVMETAHGMIGARLEV